MRVAALYDIHGNLPALEAVLADVRRAEVDRIVIGGDVLPGPMPRETLDRVLDLAPPTEFIRGNGDRVVLDCSGGVDSREVPEEFREVIRWNAAQLSERHRAALAAWPATTRLNLPGIGATLFCHATPRNDTEIFTRSTRDEMLAPIFAAEEAAIVVCGHTHMQFDRRIGATRVVNAGSVGMPFAAPGAYWLLIGSDVQLRHTSYDLERAAQRIRQTSYPQAEQFAAKSILEPPSEEQMLELFAKVELK
jgi:putative phosphoesterase